jgi:hypothetical protein
MTKSNLVLKVFSWVADLLQKWADTFGISYQTVNVVVYYIIIPLNWTMMIDYLCKTHAFTMVYGGIWLITIFAVKNFRLFCNDIFSLSVDFLLFFDRFKSNYLFTSIVICVFVPLAIYLFLLYQVIITL